MWRRWHFRSEWPPRPPSSGSATAENKPIRLQVTELNLMSTRFQYFVLYRLMEYHTPPSLPPSPLHVASVHKVDLQVQVHIAHLALYQSATQKEK